MKDIISVKQPCLLSIPLVEMLLSCIDRYQTSVYFKFKWFYFLTPKVETERAVP